MEDVIRLDFGAGDKREPGWLRVDQPVVRKALHEGAQHGEHYSLDPDIECDLRAIPLPDGYADEARAIHVIEHFYAWEALDVMKEWVRVLKPGAELAIECPCLDKVLALAQVPSMPPQYVHWALYGDPRYKEPAMTHKWAYTQTQLLKLMSGAGLVNLRAEPARFHVPIRDMRVVGMKPDEAPRVLMP
jgi:SAM-dependent methyltransferase